MELCPFQSTGLQPRAHSLRSLRLLLLLLLPGSPREPPPRSLHVGWLQTKSTAEYRCSRGSHKRLLLLLLLLQGALHGLPRVLLLLRQRLSQFSGAPSWRSAAPHGGLTAA